MIQKTITTLLLVFSAFAGFAQVNFTGNVHCRTTPENSWNGIDADCNITIRGVTSAGGVSFDIILNSVNVNSIKIRQKEIPASEIPADVLRKLESSIRLSSVYYDLYVSSVLRKKMNGKTLIYWAEMQGLPNADGYKQEVKDKGHQLFNSGALSISNVSISPVSYNIDEAYRRKIELEITGGGTAKEAVKGTTLPNDNVTETGLRMSNAGTSGSTSGASTVSPANNPVNADESSKYILKNSAIGLPASTPSYTKAEVTAQVVGSALSLINQWAEESRAEKQRIQAANEERERVAEEARYRKRQKIAANTAYLENFEDAKLPLSSSTITADIIYYFAFSTDKASLLTTNPIIYLCGVFPISKYKDGTWPYAVTVKKEIASILKSPDIVLNGYYTTKEKADSNYAAFTQSLKSLDFTVTSFPYKGKIKNGDAGDDIWDEKKPAAEKETNFWEEPNKKQGKAAKKDSVKSKTGDFWKD